MGSVSRRRLGPALTLAMEGRKDIDDSPVELLELTGKGAQVFLLLLRPFGELVLLLIGRRQAVGKCNVNSTAYDLSHLG